MLKLITTKGKPRQQRFIWLAEHLATVLLVWASFLLILTLTFKFSAVIQNFSKLALSGWGVRRCLAPGCGCWILWVWWPVGSTAELLSHRGAINWAEWRFGGERSGFVELHELLQSCFWDVRFCSVGGGCCHYSAIKDLRSTYTSAYFE